MYTDQRHKLDTNESFSSGIAIYNYISQYFLIYIVKLKRIVKYTVKNHKCTHTGYMLIYCH